MRILFFTYDLPYPLDSGGKIRAYNLLKEISSAVEVSLFSFYRNESQLDYLKHLKPYCKVVSVFKRRKLNSLQNLFYLPIFPFPASLYWDNKVRFRLEEELKNEKYDLIHLESFYTSVYLKDDLEIPQVLGTENIEWRIYQNYISRQKNFAARFLLKSEIRRIKQFEINTWKRADSILAVSSENVKTIKTESGKNAKLIPNGVDVEYFNKIKPSKNLNILFVGNFSYLQNQDAVKWILAEIWPKVLENHKNRSLKLIIAGRNAQSFLADIKNEHIRIIDNIADIRTLYQKASLVLAPLRIGSGTKFKILEGMAAGLPVVTTSLGAEGISQELEWGMTANSTDEFVSAVLKLLNNKDLCKEMGENGRKIVEKYFSWKKIGKKLLAVYEKTINNYRKL